jgi:trk system potassium uptake protein TrkA
MKIVIVGAGAVGDDLARHVSRRESDVVVIERDADRAQKAQEHLDCRVVVGNGINPRFLDDIGMDNVDLFAAVTDSDEVNIISSLTAHRLGARVKVARVRSPEYYRGDQLVLDGIDLAINPDIEAVRAMRQILWESGATDVHELAGGRVRIVGSKVDDSAFVVGKTLQQVEKALGSRWALVITVVRNGETLIPRGDTVIRRGDQVYIAGARGAVDRALTYVHAPSDRLQNVMIVGAGTTGLELARDLTALGVSVKLIDDDEQRCRRASETLHHVLVLHGDGTDVDLLTSEGVDSMDGFVAVDRHEEANMMACLLAHHHGVRKTVCQVDRPDYVPLLSQLGVDAAVSPRLSTSDAIARFVKRGGVVSTHSLGFSGSEILQFRLDDKNKCLDKPLSSIGFPRDAVVGAVLKRGHVVTPRGDTVLQAGDEVVVFALPSGVAAVETFFSQGR